MGMLQLYCYMGVCVPNPFMCHNNFQVHCVYCVAFYTSCDTVLQGIAVPSFMSMCMLYITVVTLFTSFHSIHTTEGSSVFREMHSSVFISVSIVHCFYCPLVPATFLWVPFPTDTMHVHLNREKALTRMIYSTTLWFKAPRASYPSQFNNNECILSSRSTLSWKLWVLILRQLPAAFFSVLYTHTLLQCVTYTAEAAVSTPKYLCSKFPS